jgi:hypothetical protein
MSVYILSTPLYFVTYAGERAKPELKDIQVLDKMCMVEGGELLEKFSSE